MLMASCPICPFVQTSLWGLLRRPHRTDHIHSLVEFLVKFPDLRISLIQFSVWGNVLLNIFDMVIKEITVSVLAESPNTV